VRFDVCDMKTQYGRDIRGIFRPSLEALHLTSFGLITRLFLRGLVPSNAARAEPFLGEVVDISAVFEIPWTESQLLLNRDGRSIIVVDIVARKTT